MIDAARICEFRRNLVSIDIDVHATENSENPKTPTSGPVEDSPVLSIQCELESQWVACGV